MSTTWSASTAWSSCRSTASSSTASAQASVKKGYLCLESEGAEIHFRNIQIMELPPGVTSAEQTAPEVGD